VEQQMCLALVKIIRLPSKAAVLIGSLTPHALFCSIQTLPGITKLGWPLSAQSQFDESISSLQVLASPANGIAQISDGYPINPISMNEEARDSWAAIPRTLVQFDDNSYIDGTYQFFDDYVGLEPDVQHSTHMSSPAVPNGHGVLSSTNDPQFAKRGNFGHELLYPMQGHKATCMQGQPNGTDTWDQIGFGNAFSSDDRQASAALAPPISSL
jgi:hypothetical protein